MIDLEYRLWYLAHKRFWAILVAQGVTQTALLESHPYLREHQLVSELRRQIYREIPNDLR